MLIEAFAEDERQSPRRTEGILRTLRDPRVLYLSAVYFMAEIGLFAFLWPDLLSAGPGLQGASMGRSIGLEVGIVSALPWATAILAVTLVPRYCDRHGNHRAVGALMLLLGGAGDWRCRD